MAPWYMSHTIWLCAKIGQIRAMLLVFLQTVDLGGNTILHVHVHLPSPISAHWALQIGFVPISIHPLQVRRETASRRAERPIYKIIYVLYTINDYM